jgi:uncharacterized protein (TIGR02246 family)
MVVSGRSSILIAIVLLAVACQSQPGPLPDRDVAAIRSGLDQWVKAVNAGDWATAASLFTENASFMPPNGPAVEGRANVQAWMAGFPKMQEIGAKYLEVQGRNDLAYARGTYALTLAPQGGAPAIKDNGKFVEIHRKQPDGSWKVALDIFNSDLLAARPAPVKPAKPTKPLRTGKATKATKK